MSRELEYMVEKILLIYSKGFAWGMLLSIFIANTKTVCMLELRDAIKISSNNRLRDEVQVRKYFLL